MFLFISEDNYISFLLECGVDLESARDFAIAPETMPREQGKQTLSPISLREDARSAKAKFNGLGDALCPKPSNHIAQGAQHIRRAPCAGLCERKGCAYGFVFA